MTEFLIHHTHAAEECERINSNLQNEASALRGKTLFCTCPTGDHSERFRADGGARPVAAEQAVVHGRRGCRCDSASGGLDLRPLWAQGD